MSHQQEPEERRPLDAAMKGLLIFLGALLLLPGLCALFFMFALGGGWDTSLVGLWLVCLAISAGGIALIRAAARR
jgi:hypothetical protein